MGNKDLQTLLCFFNVLSYSNVLNLEMVAENLAKVSNIFIIYKIINIYKRQYFQNEKCEINPVKSN